MSDTTEEFKREFEDLTGYAPLSWQVRLYGRFVEGDFPKICDLPTGLGKTMVMAIWLIARRNHPDKIPTRLIYVVDRRTVVDQATDLARKLLEKSGIDRLAISTLRGRLADNREWSTDPTRPAIIIGTVDLIGSALLFSGYRSGLKRRPLEAGLLGQDSLLVLDEAHLSRPFEKLVCAINEDGRFQQDRDGKPHGKPIRVIRMSATSGQPDTEAPTFSLNYDTSGDLTAEDANDAVISQRFGANKRLKIVTEDDVKKQLVVEANKLAKDENLKGKRIVVFVRRPDDATRIADAIRKLESTKTKAGPYAYSVEILTGTMRGLERDELIQKPVLKRFLDGAESPDLEQNKKPVFLVSTSAGEVGFDLNADHLVGDAAPLDSWVQRLGRVNRRGEGDATVILVKESDPSDKTDFDKACTAAMQLFTDGMDVSPKALAKFQKSLTPEQRNNASSPRPTMVELTDILLDAWSMTSITQPMPGRPGVGPWLRGVDDDLPHTTIAWRAELDQPGFSDLDIEDIAEWFDTHRVLTHETLSVPTNVAAKWFADRWKNLSDNQKSEVGNRSVVIDKAGLKLITVKSLIDQLERKNTDSILHAELILPASFGGIQRGVGLLDANAPNEQQATSDQGQANSHGVDALPSSPDVADIAPCLKRLRQVTITDEQGDLETKNLGTGTKPSKSFACRLTLASDDDKQVRLVSFVPRQEKPDVGLQSQSLQSHVGMVRRAVDGLLERLNLNEVDKETVTLAARLAADYHDHGKNRERWQRMVGGEVTPPGQTWLDKTLGKSDGEMKRDPRGYRHEFGSLREFTDEYNNGKLLDNSSKPINQDVFDLAMHLIATHHGRSRPHFAKGGFDPDCESRSEEIHTESIRRFGRLQRKYGWWHLAWLENLLRCADALASADIDAEDDPVDSEGAGK